LMMGWYRYAHRRGKQVRFTDVPELLAALIEFCALHEVLPIETAGRDPAVAQPGQDQLATR
jgi:hypothetical protein